MKKSHDYDSTFKTLKVRHKRLFISVINETFNKSYSMNAEVKVLSAEGYFVDHQRQDENAKIEEKETDFLMEIEGDYYLLECQGYDDESMSLRLAEYTFLAARSVVTGDQGYIEMTMPHYSVIYIKSTKDTPKTTNIKYCFPDGTVVDYKTDNVFLSGITKEEIIEKKLYVFIPFYIARYEKELTTKENYEKAIEDLEFFKEKMLQLRKDRELNDAEIDDIRDCVNKIVMHITDGNEIETEVTSVMGGEVFELHSEKIIRETTEKVTKEFQKKLADKDKKLADKDKKLADKDKKLADKDKKIAELEAQLAAKNS